MSKVKELVDKMPEMLNPKKAKGYKRVIQMEITGDDGGQYYLTVKDQAATVNEGVAEDANFKLTMSDEDFIGYFTGTAKAMNLVRQGRMKFTGPMTEGMAFNSIWNIPKA